MVDFSQASSLIVRYQTTPPLPKRAWLRASNRREEAVRAFRLVREKSRWSYVIKDYTNRTRVSESANSTDNCWEAAKTKLQIKRGAAVD